MFDDRGGKNGSPGTTAEAHEKRSFDVAVWISIEWISWHEKFSLERYCSEAANPREKPERSTVVSLAHLG
jgi:hypothetical protein